MHVKVCHGCPLRFTEEYPRKRCEILTAKLKAVRGVGLTHINFDCPTKLALFKPGQCVAFKGISYHLFEDGLRRPRYDCRGNRVYDDFTGFVFGWRGDKVRVVSEQTDKPFCLIRPSRLKPGPEPDRRACVHCGMPEGVKVKVKAKYDDESHEWVCREEYVADTVEFCAVTDFVPDEDAAPRVLPCEYAGEDGDA